MEQKKKLEIDKKQMANLYKRFFIVFACCVPFMVAFGLTLGAIVGSVWQVVIYCVFFIIVFYLEELIYNGKKQQRARLKEEYEKNKVNK